MEGKTEVLTVTTLNIEWFGKAGYEKDKTALFNEIEGCDVAGVQEITDPGLFQKDAIAFLGKEWSFVATEYPSQKVGLLYNSLRVKSLGFKRYDEVDVGRRVRPALFGRFEFIETGLFFDLLVVHLKSGKKKKDINIRRTQWKVLCGIVKGLSNDQNILLLGDMNCFNGRGENLDELKPFVDDTGFLLATAGDDYTMTEKCGGRIDHILVSPGLAPHLADVSVGGACSLDCAIRYEDCRTYWATVSDHCPVCATFTV